MDNWGELVVFFTLLGTGIYVVRFKVRNKQWPKLRNPFYVE